MNNLEQLLSEWYQYNGYLVRQNVKVALRKKGGYEGELDIIAFNPNTKHLVHLEPSSDTYNWTTTEKRYKKKFELGQKYAANTFYGLVPHNDVEQIAVFLFKSGKNHPTVGGGKVRHISYFLKHITGCLKTKKLNKEMVPESYPLLRVLQMYIQGSKTLLDLED